MADLWTLDDLGRETLRGKRVFVRVDFNVPLSGDGKVLDGTRLEEAVPTIRELIGAGAIVVLASHLGRPKGKPDPRYTLRPVAAALASLLGQEVRFAPDCVGEEVEARVGDLRPGGVILLENLRFHAGEEKNDPDFAGRLAALAEVYVDDAFGSAHRAHASVVGVPERLAAKAAGRLLAREVVALGRLLGEPERPFAAILGGAKIEGKIDTLENLLPRLDLLLLGGGMANTFLAAEGHELGGSLFEPDRLDVARDILARAKARGTEVLLPHDVVVTDDLGNPTRIETVSADRIPAGLKAVDVGPETRKAFAAAIGRARTLFWNGPLGVFEKPPFDAGTREVAAALAGCAGFTVIGGGETVAAVKQAGVAGRIGHVSTGGGASLEFLAGRILPGVAVLEKTGSEAGR
ncbi:MAG TPA: phosphoglycerate kinase [Thermoanaerobaculia bacterium]|jgi:phosphoglycerate kinase|nr:phosphoglycerate kinase [Thermoanaerobaculia bacterium]